MAKVDLGEVQPTNIGNMISGENLTDVVKAGSTFTNVQQLTLTKGRWVVVGSISFGSVTTPITGIVGVQTVLQNTIITEGGGYATSSSLRNVSTDSTTIYLRAKHTGTEDLNIISSYFNAIQII